MVALIILGVLVFLAVILVWPSIRIIGPSEVGLVVKRFGAKLPGSSPIAFKGEAGYQSELLKPGWRFKLWIVYSVDKFPWVQVPAGQIGVVISQVGASPPIGAKSAKYVKDAKITDVATFIEKGGEKGVQRPVLVPGTTLPLHPIAFIVITKDRVYGRPLDPIMEKKYYRDGLSTNDFGLRPEWLEVRVIKPESDKDGKIRDTVGIITTLEGDPLFPGDIAGRLGEFQDISKAVLDKKADSDLIELIIGSKNSLHNNYQDFQAFLDNGGRIGLQHDPLLYGAYTLNPFLVKVETVPMLVVEQGEVAVIKSYVGLAEEGGKVDVEKFKFGTIVHPGHRGIWNEALKTGKYAINPHCYQAEIVPVSIITLNWAEGSTRAHDWDASLSPIQAKSREGFIFKIDLQVQIHVAAAEAPAVISMVSTMRNLTTDVLQPAVGNHFRDRLQSMPAVNFIETRQQVQEDAFKHVANQLVQYHVETKGVYIQDVVFPAQLVEVLTQREVANQQIETYKKQKSAQDQRVEMEQSTGIADKQKELAGATVNVEIETRKADAKKAQADGEAAYIQRTGEAEGSKQRAIGMGKAAGYKAQIEALGIEGTTAVNVITALAEGKSKFVPDIMVGGDGASNILGTWMAKMAKDMSKPVEEKKS